MAGRSLRIGMVVRSAPFSGRSGRDQLDLAMSAMTLGFEVELIFLGAGILQLLTESDPEAAGLPPGIHGWASLPELGTLNAWAPEEQRESLSAMPLALAIGFASASELAGKLDHCDHVLVV